MKKRLTATLFTLLLATSALGLQAPASWTKFTSQAGRFSVMLPVEPKEEKETKNDGGPLSPYTNTLYTAQGAGAVYLVGWTDYKPGVRINVPGEIKANRDNFVNAIKATVATEKAIKLGTHPGTEFTAENAQAFFHVRVYVIGRRPYILVALRPKGTQDPNADKFFSSFTLTPAR